MERLKNIIKQAAKYIALAVVIIEILKFSTEKLKQFSDPGTKPETKENE